LYANGARPALRHVEPEEQLSGVMHAIRLNIESNSIRSLSLIQAVEVKSGTEIARIRIASAMGNAYAASPTIFAFGVV
jgi:hypothetical protein